MASDEEMLKAMAEAGCIGIKFGVESADPSVLKRIGKPVDLNKIRRLAKFASNLGIKTHATFTFGLNGDTLESMQKTLKFALELDVDSVQFSITTPFPGTKFYAELESKGLIITKNWDEYDGARSYVAEYENLKREDVEKIYNSAFSKWAKAKLKNPRWVIRQVKYALRQIRYGSFSASFGHIKSGIKWLFRKS